MAGAAIDLVVVAAAEHEVVPCPALNVVSAIEQLTVNREANENLRRHAVVRQDESGRGDWIGFSGVEAGRRFEIRCDTQIEEAGAAEWEAAPEQIVAVIAEDR